VKVEVHLYTGLRRYAPEKGDAPCLEVSDASRVIEVMELLGIPAGEEKVILINGRPAGEVSLLQEGDTLVLFSPLAGG
jgi:hypothetical protein